MHSISPATTDDIPQLAGLLHLLFTQEADFKPDAERQKRGLSQIIDSPQTGVILVARSGEEIVGMVSLLFTISTAEGGPVCWLEDMVIKPEQRSSGLGSRLLSAAIDHAHTHGFLRITLLTDVTNAAAKRFYQRHGFVESGMTPLRLSLT
jgi:ribosomal protein S18 acetylase RimI-like enzyme